ncbi:MAG: Uma2 family endonuclease [Pyrinomonadaceae bacterium]
MGLAKLKSKPYYTLEHFLEFEREAEMRHEFIDGEIYAMAGESGAHADISMNLARNFAKSASRQQIVVREQKIQRCEAAR